MNPVDLGQVASALRGPTFALLELPKLESLLGEVLERLAEVETASGAYSKAAVHMLLKIEGVGGSGSSAGSSGGSSAGSSRLPSRVRRTGLGSSSGGGISRAGVAQQQLQQAAAVLNGVGGSAAVQGSSHGDGDGSLSSNSSSIMDGSRISQAEVARLKQYLAAEQVVDGSRGAAGADAAEPSVEH
jgi:hypothetical protein